MRVMITGFEPFGRENINPSWEACFLLRDYYIQGISIIVPKQPLPVRFGPDVRLAMSLVQHHRPDIVLVLGQAEGRPVITLERYAYNRCKDRMNGLHSPLRLL